MPGGHVYVIRTDLNPDQLNVLATTIFAHWLEFALGQTALGGRRLMYPTGRYASSIAYRQEGEATIAIYADEGIAPHAPIIEYGHNSVDLKTRLMRGRAYPMHRAGGAASRQARSRMRVHMGPSGPRGVTPAIWADVRRADATGYASIGPKSGPESWIIPAMPAYSPAAILAGMAQRMVKGF